MRTNPLSQLEIALAHRLRDAREAAGFSRPLLAGRVGMDSSRIVKYEHGLVAIPYYYGARLFAELDVCQRWAATGAEPRKGYMEVSAIVEALIPRPMSFLAAFQRMLADEIEDRMRSTAKAHEVPIDQLTPETFFRFGPIGEHPEAFWRRVSHEVFQSLGGMIIDRCSHADAERFLAKVEALGRPVIEKLAASSIPPKAEREARERSEVVAAYTAKLAGWPAPESFRRKDR